MARRVLFFLLILALTAPAAGVTLKKLLDPTNIDYPLRPYKWRDWDKLDRETKFKSKGADISAWTDPPPDKLTDKEKEKREQQRKRVEEAKKNGTFRYPTNRWPGFRFVERLEEKKKDFETLLRPASASKLEGLVKQLKLLDKALDKYQRVIDRVEGEYLKYKEQLDKITEKKSENYKKRHGTYPEQVMVPRTLMQTVHRNAKLLQHALSVRTSELQFHAWLLERLATLIGELTPEERKKPVQALARGVADKDWRYRIRCARLLGRLGDPRSVETFKQAMDAERDPLVLAELIRIRVKRGGDGLMEFLARRLEDEHWPVRAAVVRELGRIRKKKSVDLLVARMQKEEGRLLDDIASALRRLTGRDFEPQPDPWRIWWEKSRAAFTLPPELKEGETVLAKREGKAVYFYGIRSQSKRVVFCFDISGSMNFPLDGRGGSKPARIIRAKKELNQALTALASDAVFNIVVYSVQVKVWKKRMQPANLKNKQAARRFVERLEPTGGTNIFDALLTSLDVAAGGVGGVGGVGGKGRKKRKRGADPEADTIFFLTDGQPTAGRITDANQILEEVTRRNTVLGVKIHTVGVSREQNAGFLLNLAKRNHGQYVGHK